MAVGVDVSVGSGVSVSVATVAMTVAVGVRVVVDVAAGGSVGPAVGGSVAVAVGVGVGHEDHAAIGRVVRPVVVAYGGGVVMAMVLPKSIVQEVAGAVSPTFQARVSTTSSPFIGMVWLMGLPPSAVAEQLAPGLWVTRRPLWVSRHPLFVLVTATQLPPF